MRKLSVGLFVVACAGFLVWLYLQLREEAEFEGQRLRVGRVEIWVEIADNPEAWAQGLSGREELGKNQGMLFVYPDALRLAFWMEDMRFPLDILFIRDGRVVDIHERVPAPQPGQDGREIQVVSSQPAAMVLEVNSGWVERHGVVIGDEIKLEIQ